MELLLGLLIGVFVGGGFVAAFLCVRGAHRLARKIGEEMRGLRW